MAVQARALCWLPHTHLAGCWLQPQPCRLLHSFFVLLNFHAAGASSSATRQAQVAGRFPPHPCSPMPALPAGPSCPPSPPVSCCPLLHSGHRQTAGASALCARAEPAQAASCSEIHSIPSLDCTHELLTPHCCSSCSHAMFSPQGEQELPAAPSCSCPDAAGDLSQVPPLGWKNPRLGSCRASSKPHIGDLMGTSFPRPQQEQGARGFAANPGP